LAAASWLGILAQILLEYEWFFVFFVGLRPMARCGIQLFKILSIPIHFTRPRFAYSLFNSKRKQAPKSLFKKINKESSVTLTPLILHRRSCASSQKKQQCSICSHFPWQGEMNEKNIKMANRN
jgi:hypothetical protein